MMAREIRQERLSKIEEEVAKEKGRLVSLKSWDEHIVLVTCSPEVYKYLKQDGYNIYPNRNKGYTGTYLCDLKHNLQHR